MRSTRLVICVLVVLGAAQPEAVAGLRDVFEQSRFASAVDGLLSRVGVEKNFIDHLPNVSLPSRAEEAISKGLDRAADVLRRVYDRPVYHHDLDETETPSAWWDRYRNPWKGWSAPWGQHPPYDNGDDAPEDTGETPTGDGDFTEDGAVDDGDDSEVKHPSDYVKDKVDQYREKIAEYKNRWSWPSHVDEWRNHKHDRLHQFADRAGDALHDLNERLDGRVEGALHHVLDRAEGVLDKVFGEKHLGDKDPVEAAAVQALGVPVETIAQPAFASSYQSAASFPAATRGFGVPEPGSCWLSLVALGCLPRRRR